VGCMEGIKYHLRVFHLITNFREMVAWVVIRNIERPRSRLDDRSGDGCGLGGQSISLGESGCCYRCCCGCRRDTRPS
jgi:hypothetical protein